MIRTNQNVGREAIRVASELTGFVRGRGVIRLALTSAVLSIFASTALLFSQTIQQRSHNVKNGERIYKAGCIACHGDKGTGAPQTLTERSEERRVGKEWYCWV